jgi:hypothetical protein
MQTNGHKSKALVSASSKITMAPLETNITKSESAIDNSHNVCYGMTCSMIHTISRFKTYIYKSVCQFVVQITLCCCLALDYTSNLSALPSDEVINAWSYSLALQHVSNVSASFSTDKTLSTSVGNLFIQTYLSYSSIKASSNP